MTAPLLLLSELRLQLNTSISADKATAAQIASADLRLRELIQSASETFTELCNQRRFDRYYATRYYTPLNIENDGDLISAYELLLDTDLLEIDTITNGDDTSITTGYQLLPRNRDVKSSIRLSSGGSVIWTGPGSDGDIVSSIEIAGTWGWKGSFKSSGDTVQDDPLTSSATTINVSDGANFEVGMMLKIESEYALIESIDTNELTVERGYNDTTAAEHAAGTAISYYLAERQIRQQITRLCSWRLEQVKNPMFGTVVIADVSIPTTVDEVPNDVLKAARRLRWPMRTL